MTRETHWRIELADWPGLSAPDQQTCTAAVAELGGALEPTGTAHFRRYRAAEVYALILRFRLEVPRETRMVLAQGHSPSPKGPATVP